MVGRLDSRWARPRLSTGLRDGSALAQAPEHCLLEPRTPDSLDQLHFNDLPAASIGERSRNDRARSRATFKRVDPLKRGTDETVERRRLTIGRDARNLDFSLKFSFKQKRSHAERPSILLPSVWSGQPTLTARTTVGSRVCFSSNAATCRKTFRSQKLYRDIRSEACRV